MVAALTAASGGPGGGAQDPAPAGDTRTSGRGTGAGLVGRCPRTSSRGPSWGREHAERSVPRQNSVGKHLPVRVHGGAPSAEKPAGSSAVAHRAMIKIPFHDIHGGRRRPS